MGDALLRSNAGGKLPGRGSDLVSVGILLDSRAPRVVRLSLVKSPIALESRSMRALKSSISFLASVRGRVVCVGVTGGEEDGECGASETRGEVWTTAEV